MAQLQLMLHVLMARRLAHDRGRREGLARSNCRTTATPTTAMAADLLRQTP